ncbi:hypothetical protein LBMAG21_10450 [Armatimonadota bacterium]|nr:hypothetical protein LBMAG21_10450 [Armatimonadota bacterium]
MHLTSEERAAGTMSPKNLALAVRTLNDVGYVVLEEILPLDWVENARAQCDADIAEFVANELTPETNAERAGHVSMLAPMHAPYTDAIAVENPFALQVMEAAMGKNIYCMFYNTNTAYPGSMYQRLHRDIYLPFPELDHPLPAYMVVVNIPLIDFTLENGSTEVYPGTHHITDIDPEDSQKLLERAQYLPATRTNVKAGSLVVRDMRMWHRGMPNPSDTVRTMLAIVYGRGFWMTDPRMNQIPRSTWDTFSEKSKYLFRNSPIIEDSKL